jgi:hypothetical protein
MAELTLEQRVAALEREVAALKGAQPAVTKGNWVDRLAGWFANDPVHAEMVEYGRYFRKTGQEPPPDWKPGDPIPELGDGEELP